MFNVAGGVLICVICGCIIVWAVFQMIVGSSCFEMLFSRFYWMTFFYLNCYGAY